MIHMGVIYKNITTTLLLFSVNILLQFAARLVFVRYLGIEYLGLNGLFTSVVSILSLSEAGVGTAIIYSLYKPLAERNQAQVEALMSLFKKAYIYIGLFIIAIGSILTPFIGFLLKDKPNIPNFHWFFLLFVFDTGISYFYSYRANLLIADQKQYIVNKYRSCFRIGTGLLQVGLLIFFKTFWVYIILKIMCTFLENKVIYDKSYKIYEQLWEKEAIEPEIKKQIVKNIKALIFHKMGGIFLFNSTNLLIGKLIGLGMVGIYSNYLLIINTIQNLVYQFFDSIKSTIGNRFFISENQELHEAFEILYFINAYIALIFSALVYFLANPFILLWIGSAGNLPNINVTLLAIQLYLTVMRCSVGVYKDAMGIYWNNRYMPLGEGIIAIGGGIIGGKLLGITGIQVALIMSLLFMPFIVEPYVTFKSRFNYSLLKYYIQYIVYLIVSLFIICTISVVMNGMNGETSMTEFVFKGILVVTVSTFLWVIILFRHHSLRALLKLMISKKSNYF